MKVVVDLVMAARPNFMKVAPLYHALKMETWCETRLVHTGQHFDANMSQDFLRDLGLPDPQIHLGVGAGTHAEQSAAVMVRYEKACMTDRPDWTVVVGDVNSTMACALVAAKLGIRIAHLEAGLRSADRRMPEEINRIVTDAVSDLLWTPSQDADANLHREGISPERVVRVGNIMIDSLEMMRPAIERCNISNEVGVTSKGYAVVTLHRPSNVDEPETLRRLVGLLQRLSDRMPLVFPVHPRTRMRLEGLRLWPELSRASDIRLIEPQSYPAFMSLVFGAAYVLTDSGGVQEETTYLRIPCLTLRENTERPITVLEGSNRLVSIDTAEESVNRLLSSDRIASNIPDLWDGKTSGRVVTSLKKAAGLHEFV